MSMDIILAKIKTAGNLDSRPRDPLPCLLCSAPKAIQQYEACYIQTKKFVIEEISKIKNLTTMTRKNIITWHCEDCGAERPVAALGYKYEFWWVKCKRCNCITLSPVQNKCLNCDQDAKDKLLEIEKAEG